MATGDYDFVLAFVLCGRWFVPWVGIADTGYSGQHRGFQHFSTIQFAPSDSMYQANTRSTSQLQKAG
jgi:hypothetical protein